MLNQAEPYTSNIPLLNNSVIYQENNRENPNIKVTIKILASCSVQNSLSTVVISS